jgi:hypothetical protein
MWEWRVLEYVRVRGMDITDECGILEELRISDV